MSVCDTDDWLTLDAVLLANPQDHTRWLVAADWLDDRGEAGRAAALRDAGERVHLVSYAVHFRCGVLEAFRLREAAKAVALAVEALAPAVRGVHAAAGAVLRVAGTMVGDLARSAVYQSLVASIEYGDSIRADEPFPGLYLAGVRAGEARERRTVEALLGPIADTLELALTPPAPPTAPSAP